MIGVLLVNKPAGMTSHDVVQRVRRKLGTRRVGHAGTLDPIATGLLVLAVGPATRFLQYLPLEPKEYDCTFQLGQTTNTYDSEGEVTATREVPANFDALIDANLGAFLGSIEQMPPLYSAIKKSGKPLYAYARKGEDVEVEPRRVFIERFERLNQGDARAEFRIVCSGGTYVRSLAHDLGEAVGCGAHVVELQRTRVGKFDIDDSVELDDVTEESLIPLAKALEPMPMVQMNQGQFDRVMNGQWIKVADSPPVANVALLDPAEVVVSVARVDGNLLHPLCVLPSGDKNGAV